MRANSLRVSAKYLNVYFFSPEISPTNAALLPSDGTRQMILSAIHVPPPPYLSRTEGKVKTIIQAYISAISLVSHYFFLSSLVRSFAVVIRG